VIFIDNFIIFVKNKYYDKENTLDISVNISYIEDEEKINFDEPLLLKNGSRTWYIHGISPDLFDRKLNIFYSDDLLDIKRLIL
jgi:hypothetical protein